MCNIHSHLRTKHILKVETWNTSTVKKKTQIYINWFTKTEGKKKSIYILKYLSLNKQTVLNSDMFHGSYPTKKGK